MDRGLHLCLDDRPLLPVTGGCEVSHDGSHNQPAFRRRVVRLILRWPSTRANAVRLELHALAYNLGNFLRTLTTPEPIKDWSLTSLKEKPIKIGAKVVSHGRYVIFQMAEVAIARQM